MLTDASDNLAITPHGNSDGIVYADFGGTDVGSGVLIQRDGKIVVAGRGGPTPSHVILRFESDGAPDSGFGANGSTVVDFGGWDQRGWSAERQLGQSQR